MDKSSLRQELLTMRRSLSQPQWQAKSQQLCHNLKQSGLFQNAAHILSFFSLRNEPDLSSLNVFDKQWGMPRCVGNKLVWHRWQPGDRLITGKFGITEPHPELVLMELDQVELVLVPAIACDYRGNRLGYGGGYYDRFFAQLSRPIPTIGIVFEFGLVPALPSDPWDMSLDWICTETKLYRSITTSSKQDSP